MPVVFHARHRHIPAVSDPASAPGRCADRRRGARWPRVWPHRRRPCAPDPDQRFTERTPRFTVARVVRHRGQPRGGGAGRTAPVAAATGGVAARPTALGHGVDRGHDRLPALRIALGRPCVPVDAAQPARRSAGLEPPDDRFRSGGGILPARRLFDLHAHRGMVARLPRAVVASRGRGAVFRRAVQHPEGGRPGPDRVFPVPDDHLSRPARPLVAAVAGTLRRVGGPGDRVDGFRPRTARRHFGPAGDGPGKQPPQRAERGARELPDQHAQFARRGGDGRRAAACAGAGGGLAGQPVVLRAVRAGPRASRAGQLPAIHGPGAPDPAGLGGTVGHHGRPAGRSHRRTHRRDYLAFHTAGSHADASASLRDARARRPRQYLRADVLFPRHHLRQRGGAPARPFAEDGQHRHAGGRRGARLQQPLDDNPGLHRTAQAGVEGQRVRHDEVVADRERVPTVLPS